MEKAAGKSLKKGSLLIQITNLGENENKRRVNIAGG